MHEYAENIDVLDNTDLKEEVATERLQLAKMESVLNNNILLRAQFCRIANYINTRGVDTALLHFISDKEMESLFHVYVPSTESLSEVESSQLTIACQEALKDKAVYIVRALFDDLFKYLTAGRRFLQSTFDASIMSMRKIDRLRDKMAQCDHVPHVRVRMFTKKQLENYKKTSHTVELRQKALDALSEIREWTWADSQSKDAETLAYDIQQDADDFEEYASDFKFGKIWLDEEYSIEDFKELVQYATDMSENIGSTNERYVGFFSMGVKQGKINIFAKVALWYFQWITKLTLGLVIGMPVIDRNINAGARSSWRLISNTVSIDADMVDMISESVELVIKKQHL